MRPLRGSSRSFANSLAGQRVSLQASTPPSWTRRSGGGASTCGTMLLAALEAHITGVKVRWEIIERHGCLVANVFSLNGVDIRRRLVSAVAAYRRYSRDYVAAEARKARRDVAGHLRQALGWRVTARETGRPCRDRVATACNISRDNRSGRNTPIATVYRLTVACRIVRPKLRPAVRYTTTPRFVAPVAFGASQHFRPFRAKPSLSKPR